MPLPAILAAVVSALGLILLVVVGVRGERRSRRHAAELARRGKRALPPRRDGRGLGWVALVAVGAAAFLLGGGPELLRPVAIPGVPEGPRTLIVVTALNFVVVALFGAWWEEHRKPQTRAARLARAGNIAGAIAEIEARVAARRREPAASAPLPAPGPADANPFAPPGAAIDLAGNRAQADDLNMLGVLEGMRGDWPVALARLEAADALMDGSMPAYRSNRGIALVRLGRVEAGLAVIDEALGDLPPADLAGRFEILGRAAVALVRLGHGAEARARLDEAEATCRRLAGGFPGIRKTYLGQVAALRARLAAAEATAAGAPPPAPQAPLASPVVH